MAQYICIHAINKYDKGETITRHKYKKLSESEKLFFEEIKLAPKNQSFMEQVTENIIEEDRLEK